MTHTPASLRRQRLALSLSCLLVLAACGGSGSDNNESPTPPEPTPTPTPDPLAHYQWYLSNTGQDTLAGTRPAPGVDLNMGSLYEDGIRGTGVVVAVVDSGLDIEHEDLGGNIDAAGSINFDDCPSIANLNACATGPLLNPAFPDNAHGTNVGGLIGMLAMNGLGGRGIAPEVTLKSFNMLNTDDDEDDDGGDDSNNKQDQLRAELFALGDGNLRAADVSVFNMSYGAEDVTMPNAGDDGAVTSLDRVMAATRGGKGALYIKAAGNEFIFSGSHRFTNCRPAQQHEVGCFDAATDPMSNLLGVVLTAAVNANGQRSSYSSEGAPVWISGFGGEYNKDPAYDPSASGVDIQPALLTTDWSGCQVGDHNKLPGTLPINAIDTPSSVIDPPCYYTASFNGTSAATPTVAGVTSLILQARPELKARDIHVILAQSARTPATWQMAGMLTQPARKTDSGRVFDAGWHTNQAGMQFSRWYGYGLVDAQAAIKLAQAFTPLPAAQLVEAATPDNSPSAPILWAMDSPVGAQDSSLAVTVSNDLVVERVQIAFDTTHPQPSHLLVTLRSPSGTRIPALLPYTSLQNTVGGFEVALLGVNGFLGEPSQGEWRLYVEDLSRPNSQNTDPAAQAQLTSFKLRVLGHAKASR